MRCASHGIEVEKANRACGFLTKTERQYLLGEWEIDGSGPTSKQKSQKEFDITARTRHALADLRLLQEHGGEELKSSIITHSDDVDIFLKEEVENLQEGMMKLALDMPLGDGSAEALMQHIDEFPVDDTFADVLEAAFNGSGKELMEALIPLLAEMHYELDENDLKKRLSMGNDQF
jgi:hypothetical protein